MDTPRAYARHLATYITDPSTIRALTLSEFACAPSLQTIRGMMLRPAERAIGEPTEKDGIDWQPHTFVPKRRPKAPRQATANVRTVDYLLIPPANPFTGPFKIGPRLIKSVAFDFDVEPEDILGAARRAHLVDARAVVAKLLKDWGRHSFPEIGQALGGRDHSTVINAVQKFAWYAKRNPLVRQSYQRHLKLIEEARQWLALRHQDNEAEQSVAA
jgi:hypothetical protein